MSLEKKYRLSFSDMAIVKKQLFQIGMISLHPSRLINSCYFDNSGLRMFHESEEGVLPRKSLEFVGIINQIFLLKKLRFLQ